MSYAEKCTTSSSAAHVPAGVPSVLKVGEVARVLNVTRKKVQTWVKQERLQALERQRCEHVEVVTASVVEFCRSNGLPANWEGLKKL